MGGLKPREHHPRGELVRVAQVCVVTKKARQRTLPEQLHEHWVANMATEIANLRIDMIGMDLLITDRPLPASFSTLSTEVLHP